MSQEQVQSNLTEGEIFDVLRNDRRRKVLKQLKQNVGQLTVRGLAEVIAEAEAGQSPAPRKTRQSVYNSLHQTHLPKLDALDLVDYDRDRKTVEIKSNAKQVDLYMEVVTPYGITWAEYYQSLLLLALLVMLASEVGTPMLSVLPTIFWLTVFFGVLGVSAAWRLWSRRWVYLKGILS